MNIYVYTFVIELSRANLCIKKLPYVPYVLSCTCHEANCCTGNNKYFWKFVKGVLRYICNKVMARKIMSNKKWNVDFMNFCKPGHFTVVIFKLFWLFCRTVTCKYQDVSSVRKYTTSSIIILSSTLFSYTLYIIRAYICMQFYNTVVLVVVGDYKKRQKNTYTQRVSEGNLLII